MVTLTQRHTLEVKDGKPIIDGGAYEWDDVLANCLSWEWCGHTFSFTPECQFYIELLKAKNEAMRKAIAQREAERTA